MKLEEHIFPCQVTDFMMILFHFLKNKISHVECGMLLMNTLEINWSQCVVIRYEDIFKIEINRIISMLKKKIIQEMIQINSVGFRYYQSDLQLIHKESTQKDY